MRGLGQAMLAAIVTVPALALAADTVSMSPGRWEVTTRLTKGTVDGVALPADLFAKMDEVDYSCLTAAEAADPQTYFLGKEPGDKCTPAGTAANGKVDAWADCQPAGGSLPAKIYVTGTYGRQAYELDARTDMTSDGKSVKMEARVTGRFVGACRGDED